MAGSLITMPVNGATDWSNFVTIAQAGMKSFFSVGLTHMDDNTEPTVEDGSYAIINGSMYKLTPNGSEEAFTNGSSMAANSNLYMYCVPSGATCSMQFSTTAPTWSTAKGGYYNSNDLCIGGVWKTSLGAYIDKWFFVPGLYEGSTVYREKNPEIGVWNMQGALSKAYYSTNGSTITIKNYEDVRSFAAFVQNDALAGLSPLEGADYKSGTLVQRGAIYITYGLSTGNCSVNLGHSTKGSLYGTDYNSTSINRGYINIQYKVLG